MDMTKKIYLAFGLFATALALLITDAVAEVPAQPIQEAFTGKVTGRKVRLRLEPSVDSPIVQELAQGEMIIVTGAQSDFYAVVPPSNLKAYVYRTYVIDDVVEGNHVNVRSEPSLEAPVIAQLNKGDHIDGHISPVNNKWLQIRLPENVRFYVAYEFVEKVGDVHYMARIEKRKQEACAAVDNAHNLCQDEMCKPYPQINMDTATYALREAVRDFQDVPEHHQRACDYITQAHENYIRKRIDFLETEAQASSEAWNVRCQALAQQMATQSAHLDALERSLHARDADLIPQEPPKARILFAEPAVVTEGMSMWTPQEIALFETWQKENEEASLDDFYTAQAEGAVHIRGNVQPYRRMVKNKPGNFILIDQVDNIPIAFLYSTKVDLEQLSGKTTTLLVAPRPNNNFAFPAYYVLDVASRK